jgi:uncharacterized membrane protein YvlD (DUF360 family)
MHRSGTEYRVAKLNPASTGSDLDGFWSGFWGAIILGIVSWLLGLLLRPARR